MPLEMVSCGRCKRCLAGGRVHGPYPYRWEGSGDNRRHLYGSGESLELQRLRGVDEEGQEEIRRMREEAKRLQEEAEQDAEERERRLTPELQEKRDGIMVLIARLQKIARQLRLVEGRRSKVEKLGLIERGMKELRKQAAEQLRHEAKDLRKQIKQEKKELAKMLAVE